MSIDRSDRLPVPRGAVIGRSASSGTRAEGRWTDRHSIETFGEARPVSVLLPLPFLLRAPDSCTRRSGEFKVWTTKSDTEDFDEIAKTEPSRLSATPCPEVATGLVSRKRRNPRRKSKGPALPCIFVAGRMPHNDAVRHNQLTGFFENNMAMEIQR